MKTLPLVLGFTLLSTSLVFAGGNTEPKPGSNTSNDPQKVNSVTPITDARVIVKDLPCGLPFFDVNSKNNKVTYTLLKK